MPSLTGSGATHPDIARLRESGDIRALIVLLDHANPDIERRAAEALGALGETAVQPLLSALRSHSVPVRLGAIEALGMIRTAQAFSPLTALASRDRSPEVRWGAVLALGEIGAADAVPALVPLIRDPNRYIRYGAARSLERLGWHPENREDQAFFLIAQQDWESVKLLGPDAAPHLAAMLRDDDPVTREMILSLLALWGTRDSHDACRSALRDRDPRVRWRAVLSSMNCGLAPFDIPVQVAARQRTGPNPAAAALLNFLFLGIGYNYLGKWWGFPVFMAYMSVLVLAQLAFGPFIPYAVAYPVTALLGVQTYFMAERMADG